MKMRNSSGASPQPLNSSSRNVRAPRGARRVSRLGWATGLERLEERVVLSATLTPADLRPNEALIRWGATDNLPVIAGSYIITFQDYQGAAQAELLAREMATRLGVNADSFASLGRGGWATFRTDDYVAADSVSRVLRDMPGVLGFEPDTLKQLNRVPNDARFADQWWLNNTGQLIGNLGTPGADIGAVAAWDTTIGSRDVVVGIIDTGIDITHPDLLPNLWNNPNEIPGNAIDDDGNGYVDDIHGFDFGENTATLTDPEGHGTSVSGMIGAAGNNNIGVTGVNWVVSLMGLKVANRFGGLSTAAIIAAHDYASSARQAGINIVVTNGSYGAYRPSFYDEFETGVPGERTAIERWQNAGGIFVASAGNSALDNDSNFRAFPASYNLPGIIAVAASDNNDGIAGFSSYGAQTVDLAAPGVNTLTTATGGGYTFFGGTSAAAPAVTGAVALLKSIRPTASATEIRQLLIDSSDQLPAFQGKVRSGGRLNLERAIQLIGIEGPAVRSLSVGPVTGQLSGTGQPITSIDVRFTRDIDPAALSSSAATLVRSGNDGVFGSGDDASIPIASITRSSTDARLVTIAFNLSAQPLGRLPIDNYRLTLLNTAFRDLQGNRLNGTTAAGTDEVSNFRVVLPTGDNEPNDTLGTATPVLFDASSRANFQGITLGNGLAANLDVDIYRIDLPRGGLITAEVTAQRRAFPSSLDSVLRLFNSRGEQIALNDQFFGNDSFVDFFVTTGGAYYIAVSGFGNSGYDPNTASSGSSQSLGVYDLALSIELVTDDVVTVNADSSTLPRRVPAAENQTQGTTTAFINISDSRQIKDLNLQLNITHTFVSDLVVSLISPNNTEVILINHRAGATTNFSNIVLDDEAITPIANYPVSGAPTYRPDNTLGTFDGLSAAGLWTLRIQDTVPQNSGNLLSWSLNFTFEQNIFGPFEFNDTLTASKNLNEIAGTGTANRDGFLGDGAFGARDRDIFRFTADAGTSLTATITSGGQLNSLLRLFDSQGNQILISNPQATRDSRIESYVFPTGGTFYLAVSEANNANYAPNATGANDVNAQNALTTGAYTLDATVTAGVGDPPLTLNGNRIQLGVNSDGTLTGLDSASNRTGLQFDGTEFIAFGENAGQLFLGAVAGSASFLNAGPGNTTQPFSLVDRSDASNNIVGATSIFRNLKIERTISFGDNDSFIAIDVILTNVGGAAINGIGWMEGFNPNPGLAGEGNINTNNDVIGRLVRATYTSNNFQGGLTVALAAPAADTRAVATVLNANDVIRDPAQLLDQPVNDPNGAAGDQQLALTFNIGNLAAGNTTRLRYFVMLGSTQAAVDQTYGQLNNGSGAGHLVANVTTDTNGNVIVSTNNPAPETLQTGTGAVVTAPRLPYSLYYPEGFAGSNITTTLHMSNATALSNRVVVIARFETGVRDQILFDGTVGASGRQDLEILTPERFNLGTALINRASAPYAVEIRSEQPLAATFTHVDLNLAGGATSTLGESFTSRTSQTWSFAQVSKGNGNMDFLLVQNVTDQTSTFIVTLYPLAGGAPVTIPLNVEGFRRGGLAFNDQYRDSTGTLRTLADGSYGVVVTSAAQFVASVSHYNFIARNSEGAIGTVGAGVTRGVTPEGQFGLNSTDETVTVLNPNATATDVTFTFIYANGSADRRLLNVPGRSVRQLPLSSLANFTRGQAYSVTYESPQPVTITSASNAFSDQLFSSIADRAYSYWGFGDGFRAAGTTRTDAEYLRVYNPSLTEVTIEITIQYSGNTPSTEVFRRTIAARRVAEFSVDDFITGARRNVNSTYGLTVKSPAPVVAYYAHAAVTSAGAYGTLGTPLGLTASL